MVVVTLVANSVILRRSDFLDVADPSDLVPIGLLTFLCALPIVQRSSTVHRSAFLAHHQETRWLSAIYIHC